jgi:hypothetical protein
MKLAHLYAAAMLAVLCDPRMVVSQERNWPTDRELVGEWRFQEQLEGNVTGWPVHCETSGLLRISWENGALVGRSRTERMRCRNPNRSYSVAPFQNEFAVQYTAPGISFFVVDGCPYTATVDSGNSGLRGTLECTIEDEGEPMHVYGEWHASREGPPPMRAPESRGLRQTPHLCGTSGRFAVFAFRPLGSSSVKLVPWPADNHQIAHEQLFFCDGGVVIENMGFGTLDRMFDGHGTVLVEDTGAFARYEIVDPTLYDYDTMSRVVLRMCQPRQYDVLTGNCQHWADEQRRLYAAAITPAERGVIRRRDRSGAAPERRVIRRRGDSQPRR